VSDRTHWNKKYRDDHTPRHINARLIQFAPLLKTGRVLDLAGGMGQNGAYLAAHSDAFRVINADASDEALARAPRNIARVVVETGALPFPKNCFDTIFNIRFFDPRVKFLSISPTVALSFLKHSRLPTPRIIPLSTPRFIFTSTAFPKFFKVSKFCINKKRMMGHRCT